MQLRNSSVGLTIKIHIKFKSLLCLGIAHEHNAQVWTLADGTYLDAEEHFKSLNDKQKCSIIDLQNEIGKLKNEQERQNEEIKEKDFLYKLESKSNMRYTEEIVKLSKQKDGMKKEIETLKKQISEQEAEIRQHEFSQLNKELGLDIGRKGIKPEQPWSLSMPFFFHQQESEKNQPEEKTRPTVHYNVKP